MFAILPQAILLIAAMPHPRSTRYFQEYPTVVCIAIKKVPVWLDACKSSGVWINTIKKSL